MRADWTREQVADLPARLADRQARRIERRQKRAWTRFRYPTYKLPPNPDELDLLLAAGWGDVDRPKIPADVLADAKAGKMPRRKG